MLHSYLKLQLATKRNVNFESALLAIFIPFSSVPTYGALVKIEKKKNLAKILFLLENSIKSIKLDNHDNFSNRV